MKYVYLFDRLPSNESRASRTLTFSRKQARTWAKTFGGHVYRMSYGLWKDGRSPYGWDFPTFVIQSEQIIP